MDRYFEEYSDASECRIENILSSDDSNVLNNASNKITTYTNSISCPYYVDEKAIWRHLHWVMLLRDKYDLASDIIFPQSVRTENEVPSYLTVTDGGQLFRDYYRKPTGINFLTWYFDTTEGIRGRLRNLQLVICCLKNIHEHGICITDISLDNLWLYISEDLSYTVKFIFVGSLCSYSHRSISTGVPRYRDPLVYLGHSSVSVVSDTYSFAIVLFEILMGCHPFVGDFCKGHSEKEIDNMIDAGKVPYVGDLDNNTNWNDAFADMDFLFPEDLLDLFRRMFCEGLLDVSKRPSLSDFENVLDKMVESLSKCQNCNREHFFIDDACPFCRRTTPALKIDSFMQTSFTNELILPDSNSAAEEFSNQVPINSFILRKGNVFELGAKFLGLSGQNEEVGKILLEYDADLKVTNYLINYNVEIYNDKGGGRFTLEFGNTIKLNFRYIRKRIIRLTPKRGYSDAIIRNDVYGFIKQDYTVVIA